jgi:hypothetical protein
LRNKKSAPAERLRRAAYFTILLVTLLLAFNIVAAELVGVNSGSFFYASSAAVSFSFSATAIIYLAYIEKGRKGVVKRLGLGLRSLSLRNVGLGVFVFLIILLVEVITGIISSVANVTINTNVGLLFAGAPLWFYVFATLIAPINEEILFRGLMVPRIGIVFSAIAFAVPHVTYDSSFFIEVIAALIFGVLAGYVYKKTGSLYASIVAHILVNLLAAAAILSILV